MTKKALIEAIEQDGNYDRVQIDADGNVTGHEIGTPDQYDSATNTGGRVLISYDTDIVVALVESGQITSGQACAYADKWA